MNLEKGKVSKKQKIVIFDLFGVIIDSHSKSNPKFTKKNHERNVNLEDKQLVMWYTGLVSKII